jgi:hypothetical protein
MRLIEPIWKVRPESYLLLPAADSKRGARSRPNGDDVRARTHERAGRGNGSGQCGTAKGEVEAFTEMIANSLKRPAKAKTRAGIYDPPTLKIREGFLERTLMGPKRISIGDIMKMVEQIRMQQGGRREGESSSNAKAMLALPVTDVGWGR